MINIEINYGVERICFRATGHALFAKKRVLSSKNYDLVCCAVSTLILNWYFSLRELCDIRVDSVETEHPGEFEIITQNNQKVELLFRSLMLGLVNLEQKYPKNINIKLEDNNGS